MKHFLAWFAASASLTVSAAITPLPGSAPQTVIAGQPFAPIRLLVTDASSRPLPGAHVRYSLWESSAVLEDRSTCFPDLGMNCTAIADGNGIAQLNPLRANVAGTTQIYVHAETDTARSDLGDLTIVLTVLPAAETGQLERAYGNGSRFVIGQRYASPFAVHAVKADGTPLAGMVVQFSVASSTYRVRGRFVSSVPNATSFDGSGAIATTDMNGFATSPDFVAGWGIGPGEVIATLYNPDARDSTTTTFGFIDTDPYGRTDTSFTDLWWGGPAQNGWGAMVVQHGEKLFNTFFVFDQGGEPTWYAQTAGGWTEGLGTVWSGAIYSPRSSPYFAYDASRFSIGTPLPFGSFGFLSFQGPEAGALVKTPGMFPQVVKSLSRVAFSPGSPAPNKGISDLWWGGIEQNGWGINIVENDGDFFAVWFTYDANGKPVWFPMEGGSWVDDRTYRGTISKVRGSPWPEAYDASRLQVTAAGTFSVHIDDLRHLTFEYSLDGHTGRMPLVRLDF